MSSDVLQRSDRSILAMMKGRIPGRRPPPGRLDVRRLSTKDWLTASTPSSTANFRHSWSRSVKALMPRSIPEGSALCGNAVRRRPPPVHTTSLPPTDTDFELDEAVIQEEGIPGFDHFGESLKGDRNPPCVPPDRVGGQLKGSPGVSSTGSWQIPDPHLRPGQVGHDGQPFPRFRAAAAGWSMTLRWPRKSPWEKLSRAIFMPARIICFHDLGRFGSRPDVQTILVLWGGRVIGNLLVIVGSQGPSGRFA